MDPIEIKGTDHVTPAPMSHNPLSPERRTRSYESNLDQLELGPNSVEPLTPTKKRNGLFGSFEKGLDQVRLLLTPKKDPHSNQGNQLIIISN